MQKCCPVIGLFDRDVAVIQMALRRGIPCATVIGGGYDDDIDVLGRRHSIIHRAAIKVNHEKQTSRTVFIGFKGYAGRMRQRAVRSFWCRVKMIFFTIRREGPFIFSKCQ